MRNLLTFLVVVSFFCPLAVAQNVLIGDVNRNMSVGFEDIDPLLDRIATNTFQIEADLTQDGFLDALDIDPLVDVLYTDDFPALVPGDVATVSMQGGGEGRVGEAGKLRVIVDATINGASFVEGGFGISLTSSNPGVIHFTNVRVMNREVCLGSCFDQWGKTHATGIGENSIDEIIALSMFEFGMKPLLVEDGPLLFADVDYEIVGNGVTTVSAGPITSREGSFLVHVGRDVTDRVVFDNSVVVDVIGVGDIDGDFNRDGNVDANDLSMFLAGFSSGSYDGSDFLDWQRNYGEGSTPASYVAVPEPGNATLLIIAIGAAILMIRNPLSR